MVVKKACDDAFSSAEVNRKVEPETNQENERDSTWNPPCPDFIKCNLGYLWSKEDKFQEHHG